MLFEPLGGDSLVSETPDFLQQTLHDAQRICIGFVIAFLNSLFDLLKLSAVHKILR